MKTYEITQEQGDLIASYLAKQPFAQVEFLINILRNLKPIEEKKKDA
jgi:hypothetical protein